MFHVDRPGETMGPKNWKADWRCAQGPYEMGHIAFMGTHTLVRCGLAAFLAARLLTSHRNASAPRLASSSKDGTVRVWSTLMRRCEYTLGGHTASVNVVRWGGGGLNGKGILYTASSVRTVRVWDANGVSIRVRSSSLISVRPWVGCAHTDHPRENACTRSRTTRTG